MLSAFYRPFKIKLGKRSFTCYNVDTRMDDMQHLNPRWRLVINRDACAAFWKQT